MTPLPREAYRVLPGVGFEPTRDIIPRDFKTDWYGLTAPISGNSYPYNPEYGPYSDGLAPIDTPNIRNDKTWTRITGIQPKDQAA